MTVKEDDSLELTRSQDSVLPKCVTTAGYNWEYLFMKRNCKLAASFGVFLHRFFLLFFLFFF
jgi:hypothetical protein